MGSLASPPPLQGPFSTLSTWKKGQGAEGQVDHLVASSIINHICIMGSPRRNKKGVWGHLAPYTGGGSGGCSVHLSHPHPPHLLSVSPTAFFTSFFSDQLVNLKSFCPILQAVCSHRLIKPEEKVVGTQIPRQLGRNTRYNL